MAEKLLIVEDEQTLSDSLRRVLSREGYVVETAHDAETALNLLGEGAYDIMITDIILPGISGIELLKRIREMNSELNVIVMTAFASLETAVEALRAGAYDYIIKPVIHEEIRRLVRNALNERALRVENALLKKQIERHYDFGNIIGSSPPVTALITEVQKIADSMSNILLLGETGTGKELFARSIHYNSSRSGRHFIPINCSAIPDTLLESELFGYIKGAFTGANATKRGLFEEADGGSIFLDEIGELSLQLQAKLLRVIDDREIRPLGGVQSKKVDVRIISATNKNLLKAVQDGSFRDDLYYRINVITMNIPPLRNHKSDIPALAAHFLERYARELGKPVPRLDEAVKDLLVDYHWPGNVRELQNIIERAVLLCDREFITEAHLPESVRSSRPFADKAIGTSLSIEDYTREFIKKHEKSMNEQQIAELLGITRKSLWEKRKKWKMPRNREGSMP